VTREKLSQRRSHHSCPARSRSNTTWSTPRLVSHQLIERHRSFGVNVLKSGQERLSELAAGHAGDRGNWLEGVPYRKAETGAPILSDCLAWFDCSLEAIHEGGDHTIFVGRVEAAGHSEGRPLLYFEGEYHRPAEPRPRHNR